MFDFLEPMLRFVSAFLDNIVYGFMVSVYNLIVTIAETTIFTEEIFVEFASRVYALLGIFMLFKVSFSLLTYIVNPNEFMDKSKGFSKLITNIIVSLTLLVVTPWLFGQAMELQRIILRDGTIEKIFTSIGSQNNLIASVDPGANTSFNVIRAFYYLDPSYDEACAGLTTLGDVDDSKCQSALGLENSDYQLLTQTVQNGYALKSSSIYLNSSVMSMRNPNTNEYVMEYMPFISTIAGGFICWIFVIFAFDIALRSVKLGFYQLVAPIPIVSRLDPKKGEGIFNKWLQSVIKVYLDLFIRLLAIYFVMFLITNIELTFVNAVSGVEEEVNPLVGVFIIFGALLFAKQLPQIITDLTGIKLDGKFTLNPMKKLSEVPLAGKPLANKIGSAADTSKRFAGAVGGMAADKVWKSKPMTLPRGAASGISSWSNSRKSDFNKSELGRRMAGGDAYDKQTKLYDDIMNSKRNIDKELETEILKNKHASFNEVNQAKNLIDVLKASQPIVDIDTDTRRNNLSADYYRNGDNFNAEKYLNMSNEDFASEEKAKKITEATTDYYTKLGKVKDQLYDDISSGISDVEIPNVNIEADKIKTKLKDGRGLEGISADADISTSEGLKTVFSSVQTANSNVLQSVGYKESKEKQAKKQQKAQNKKPS